MKVNLYLIGGTLVAALGGLLFGFDTAVISGTTDALTKVFDLQGTFLGVEGFWLGLTVASALVGTIIGAVAAGKPADVYGRRKTLMAIALLYLASAIGCALPWNWSSFLFFRFVGGLGIGGASVLSPLYIAEISPARYRGRLGTVTQLNIVFGMLLAFFSNWFISQLHLGESEWRWMFGVAAFPSALFFGLLFFTPLSPRWLVAQGRIAEARQEICDLGADEDNVDEELQAIQASLALDHRSLDEPFFRWQYRTPIFLVVVIAMFNQLSGINAVLYYAPTVFQMAGAPRNAAMLQTVAIGGTMLIFVALALLIIDHFGRRNLMIVGSIGYILSLGATAWAFYTYGAPFAAAHKAVEANIAVPPDVAAAVGTGGTIVLVSLLAFIASHSFGQGAVIWVFISEIFPNRVRARGQALGCFTHWIMAAVISWTFPIFAAKSGAHTFAFYCAMMVLQLLWTIFLMPETKGIPLEEIQKKLGIE
jgi:MFS transporter, SP family, xylose:H+ symportor